MSGLHMLNRYLVIAFLVFPFLCGRAYADTYGLVGKSLSDAALVEIWRGCEAMASRNDDHCTALGATGDGHPRYQKRVLSEALQSDRFKGLGISVSHSDLIAEVLKTSPLPLITIDVPFSDKDNHLSIGHIGVDNLALGKDLANVVRELHPKGGNICIMASFGLHRAQMEERLLGLRRGLSGEKLDKGVRLNGHQGWREVARCPWNNGEKSERALTQLDFTLNHLDVDVFVSIDNWVIADPRAYQKVVAPYKERIETGKTIMVLSIGGMRSEYSKLLRTKLVHGYLMINYFQLGQGSYTLMKAMASGESIPPVTYIRNHKTYLVKPEN
ncbi:hypothetical protein VA7868_03645 [Vibrio aerogenes CECT 7868]|uniref:Autoinducer 2-binding periplasmic protein LuxP n=1 Tax=Vibrio aerogenes CECT 7868 TaxID=1216006 RepID=A0A1M6ARB6_9VIBR|nr:substrate-binding domain-containing protein [Vibrio aerogenes]SHI38961.1 hypothetical protein VA7868_03645 [Vibrio aerogenes CECT 7868]